MTVRSVSFRTFCHATEDPDRVTQALRTVLGDGVTPVKVTRSRGHFGEPFITLEAVHKGRRTIVAWFRHLAATGVLDEVLRGLDARLDDSGSVHLRLAKQEACLGRLVLASGLDVVDVRCRVESHPARRNLWLAAFRAFVAENVHAGGGPDQSVDGTRSNPL